MQFARADEEWKVFLPSWRVELNDGPIRYLRPILDVRDGDSMVVGLEGSVTDPFYFPPGIAVIESS